MKKYLLYNTLLNIALVLMILSAVAAYNSSRFIILAISVAIVLTIGYVKYRLLKKVKHLTKSR